MFLQATLSLFAIAACLQAQDAVAFDAGAPPTRNNFTPLQAPLVYQPQSAFLVGRGRWQVSLTAAEASIFDFTSILAGLQNWGFFQQRTAMNPAFFQVLPAVPRIGPAPFFYYFDEEISRVSVQARVGIGERTDLFFEGVAESHAGGSLDPLAETIHRVTGWSDVGRTLIDKNQTVIFWMTHGQIQFDQQTPIRPHVQDPLVGLVHRLAGDGDAALDLVLTIKPPIARTYNYFESGWDTQAALTGCWKAGASTFNYGAGYTHRPPGNAAYNQFHYTDDLGAHFGWQGRTRSRVQPFFQLYWLSGFARLPYSSTWHKASLQHDLGAQWFVTPKSALSLHYINNITENGNTDDFQVALRLVMRM